MSNDVEMGLRYAAQIFAAMQPLPANAPAPDRAWWLVDGEPPIPASNLPVTVHSQYVTMPDGTRIAVDVWLPAGLPKDTQLAAILNQTRYFRRFQPQDWAQPLAPLLNPAAVEARRYAAAGYALVVVDVRGSGASFGYREAEIGAAEVADGTTLCDWIVAQPWCNGSIVATGVSYGGTTAEQLLRNRHPAVKAAVLRYSLFDLYPDLWMPGGIALTAFQAPWSAATAAMDANRVSDYLRIHGGGQFAMIAAATCGVSPVDSDADGALLAEAVAEHRDNQDLMASSRDGSYRNDPQFSAEGFDALSAPRHIETLRRCGVPIYSWSGYWDGGYPYAAVKRWLALTQDQPQTPHQLILGPWDHGGRTLADPQRPGAVPRFDAQGAMIRFFDQHSSAAQRPLNGELPVHYYTVNEGLWKHAATWPPGGFVEESYFLAADHCLTLERPTDEAADTYRVDYSASSGLSSRWQALANFADRKTGYINRAEQDKKLLIYETTPLTQDCEVTGHARLELFVAADSSDCAFHAYLEEVLPDGRVFYVTEGVLRASHRQLDTEAAAWERLAPTHSHRREDALPLVPGEIAEICFGLQPISYLFRAGSRIRLALAGADRDNFERVPAAGAAPNWQIHRSAQLSSRLVLPVRQV